jgi:hypothetical protein
MSDIERPVESNIDPIEELRTHAEALERRLVENERESRARIARAELKVEAVRAGIVDLDGLKLLDTEKVTFTPDGELANASDLVAQLKRAKPWLFGSTSSSSSQASPPPVQPPRQKFATEMSDDEYRIARAAFLKHQA